jgi:membrane protein
MYYASGKLRDHAENAFLILRESVSSFRRNNNFETAATLAFYGFFAMIPLLVLVLYLLGNYIISSQTALKGIENLTAQMFPAYNKIILREVFALSKQNTWGLVSLLALFWSITPLVTSMRNASLRIFKEDRSIPLIKEIVFDFSAVFAVLVTFVFIVVSEVIYSNIIGELLKENHRIFQFVNAVVPPAVGMMFIIFFFLIISPVKLKWTHVVAGSLAVSLLWAVIRPVFILFLKFNPSYGYTFGSLKAIFIIIVWVYYSFAVLLFGTEIIANARRKETLILSNLFLNDKRPVTISRIHGKFLRTYGINEVIFREDEEGQEMYYILSGAVSLSRRGQHIRTLATGGYFGEISMLLQTPRSATAVAARNDTQLVVISRENFGIILKENPKIVMNLLKEMADRVKTTNESLVKSPLAE